MKIRKFLIISFLFNRMTASRKRSNSDVDDRCLNMEQGLSEILQFYECPANCQAECCKVNEIGFTEFEKKRILKMYPQIRKKLDLITEKKSATIYNENVDYYVIKDNPCPLLEDDKCSIHNANPFICCIYPFKPGKLDNPRTVKVDPCPMGLEITVDYFVFKKCISDEIRDDGGCPLDPQEISLLYKMKKSSEHYVKGESIPTIHIPVSELGEFIAFIDLNLSALKNGRHELIDMIEIMYDRFKNIIEKECGDLESSHLININETED